MTPVDCKKVMRKAEDKVERKSKLMWPENEEKRKATEEELTWRFFKQYTTP